MINKSQTIKQNKPSFLDIITCINMTCRKELDTNHLWLVRYINYDCDGRKEFNIRLNGEMIHCPYCGTIQYMGKVSV